MSIEDMGKQIVQWAVEASIDVLKAWTYIWVVCVVIAYYVGV